MASLHSPTPPDTLWTTYPKGDYDALNEFIADYDLSFCSFLDVDSAWSKLKQILSEGCSRYIPKVKLKPHNPPKWFNSSIRHHLNCIHSLRRRFRNSPSPSLSDKLHQQEQQLQNLMTQTRIQYEENLFADYKNNCKAIHHYLNQIKKSSGIPQQVYLNDRSAITPLVQANLFNEYFHSVYGTSSTSSFLPNSPPTTECLSDITISEEDVFQILSSLDPSKAMGIDHIGPRILKSCAVSLSGPLSLLFQRCIDLACIPDEWKIHVITPLLKKGDSADVSNYRPISLLCSVSKVLERLIFNHVSDYIYPYLSTYQFGFIPDRSCLQQLLSTFSIILQNYSSHKQTDIVYLDFCKAFDSIPHTELLYKINQLGISGNVLEWFQSYLSCRRQSVLIDGIHSSMLPVTSGVPQGSILGPLLFVIFINDLPNSIHSSTPLLFADDTKCIMTICSPNDSVLLQNDLNLLADWSSQWKLSFNTTKCKLLRILPSNHSISSSDYTINNHNIDFTTSHRDLGVMISNDTQWDTHYNLIISKAHKTLHFIRRSVSNSHSSHTKLNLYTSLVRPILMYCSQVWRPHKLKDTKCFESVQRRATKYILHDYHSAYKERLISLHLLPLSLWFEYLDITFLINCLKNPSDHYFNIHDYVQFISSNTRSSSSSKLKCTLSRSSNNHINFFYFNRVVKLWNTLPIIDLSLSFLTIKKNLKLFLWEHFINSFNISLPCTWFVSCPCSDCTTMSSSMNFTTL